MTVLFYGGSLGAGIISGWLFVTLWRLCASREKNRAFWALLRELTARLLIVDNPRALLVLYRQLAVGAGSYVFGNLGGVILASVPILAFLLLVAPAVLDKWDASAPVRVVWPETGSVQVEDVEQLVESDGARHADASGEPRAGRTAICWNVLRCASFRSLGFNVFESAAPLTSESSYVVLRVPHGDRNFLWPFLSDLEFAYFCAMILGSLGALVWRRPV